MELKIDQEFKDLVPALSVDEVLNLEQSILSEGCRDAIVTWNGFIIDGHNRYAICTKHGIPFQTKETNFENRNDVRIWMIKNQFGRRSLNNFARAELALKLEEFFKVKAKDNIINSNSNRSKDSTCQKSDKREIDPIDTKKELAKLSNTSHDTISKVKEIKNSTPAEVKDKLEDKLNSGDISINQAHRALKAVKNDENGADILEKSLKKIEDQPKMSFENAVKETKEEIDLEVKEKKPEMKKSVFNFTNDNIEWAKWTWNPVTGCKYGCPYCYARDIANRFNSKGFEPTFHENRLNGPVNTTIPKEAVTDIGFKNVFVCSMADLFGNWVPNEWIEKVLKAVRENPQWNFLFLTKNPARLINIEFPDNAWVGTTVDVQSRVEPAINAFRQVKAKVKFLSCEPLQERLIFEDMSMFDWLIIGGRSRSSGMPEFQPEWAWVEELLIQARKNNLKVYFKPNLRARPTEYPKKHE